jgi:hypothetical protein
MIAYHHVPFVNVEELTVRRKGKVIKGETEQNIAAALKERQAQKNALKRQRRANRAA